MSSVYVLCAALSTIYTKIFNELKLYWKKDVGEQAKLNISTRTSADALLPNRDRAGDDTHLLAKSSESPLKSRCKKQERNQSSSTWLGSYFLQEEKLRTWNIFFPRHYHLQVRNHIANNNMRCVVGIAANLNYFWIISSKRPTFSLVSVTSWWYYILF